MENQNAFIYKSEMLSNIWIVHINPNQSEDALKFV